MKFDKQCEIDKACAAGATRYAIDHVCVTPDGHIVATDGRMMAVASCELESGDKPQYVPVGAFKLVRSGMPCKQGHINLAGNPKVKAETSVTEFTETSKKPFPKPRDVIPNLTDKHVSIALNPAFLHRLAQAIGIDDHHAVTLHFVPGKRTQDGGAQILVHGPPHCQDDVATLPFGILMPCQPLAPELLQACRERDWHASVGPVGETKPGNERGAQ